MADLSLLDQCRLWERLNEDPDCRYVLIEAAQGGRAYIRAIGDTPLEQIVSSLEDDKIQFLCLKVCANPRARNFT